MRRIFHIDLDAFFVSVERALDPSLDGVPVVVGGTPGSRGVVACASYEARAYGLHAGMPIHEAYRRCPQAVYLSGSYQRYQEVSDGFMAVLRRYSPFLEPVGIDEAYLDMTGFESLYGPAIAAARHMKQAIRHELGVVASVGIASCKVAAKVASDAGKPDGLLEVPEDGDAAFLAPLPVADLPGAGGKTAERLKALGIVTIGGLASLSEATLRRLFGAWGDLLHRWANGQDTSPVVYEPVPPKSISRETTFPHNTRDTAFLDSTLRYLAERVGAELREQEMRARCVDVKLRYSDFHTVSRSHMLPRPVCHDDAIFDAGQALLAKALRERPGLVRLIGIGVAELAPASRQLALIELPEARQERLCQAVDSLRDRHGFTSIQTGRTLLLRDSFPTDRRGYVLKTACLSR
jgi:DNA polymerase-4